MALISIFCKESSPYILSCTETHYLLDKGYSFVNMEFSVYFPEEAKELFCAIHGSIIDRGAFTKSSRNKQNDAFFKYVDVGDNKSDPKIFDFAKTFIWNIPTNNGYEGPFTQIRARKDNSVEIYGIQAYVSNNEFKTNVDEEECASLITISNTQSGHVFEKGKTYVFRIGTIISYYIPSWFKCLSPFKIFIPYHIHFFSMFEDTAYRENFSKSFTTWRVFNSIKNCLLVTKISKTQGLIPLIEQLQKSPVTKDDICSLHKSLEVPHTDVWLLIPNKWMIRKTSPKNEIVPTGSARYILYSAYKQDVQFHTYHMRVSEDMDMFRDMSIIDLKDHEIMPFNLMIETIRFNILENYQRFFAFMGSFSVIYIFTHSKRKAFYALVVVFVLWYVMKYIRDKYYD